MPTVLKVEKRDLSGPKGSRLRREGIIPVEFYGKGMDNEHFQVKERDLQPLFRSEEHVVELQSGSTKHLALLQETQRDAVTGRPIHVSFKRIHKGQKTWVTVALHLDGIPAGTKEGGVLTHSLREIEVECAPESVPHSLHHDVSALNVGDVLHVRDIVLPNGVALHEKDLDHEIASVQIPKQEAEPEVEVAAAAEAAEGDVDKAVAAEKTAAAESDADQKASKGDAS